MKRTGYIKRKVGLKSGPSKQKAKRMKAVSPKRAERRKVARERFMDGFGVYFDEVPLLLGPVAKWPKVRLVDDEASRKAFASGRVCSWCQWNLATQTHHIIGGSRGRCDSLTNLFPICGDCHRGIQSDAQHFQRVLVKRWRLDRATVSWVRLTLLHGRFFEFDTLS